MTFNIMNFKIAGSTIGSLPYTNPQEAIVLTFKYTPLIPAWPQLPKRTFKENMYAQYSENFPGVVIDDQAQKIFVNTETALSNLEVFYSHYLDNDFEYFAISPEYAAGFYQLLNHLITQSPNHPIIAIKCQTTGPVTFGLAIKTTTGEPIFYDTQLRDAVVKHITMKSIWQLKHLTSHISHLTSVILFLDEPYLAAYGSVFTAISREEIVNSLQEVITGIKNSLQTIQQSNNPTIQLLIGVHCCANTDWSILFDTDIDILSFDAYEFFDNLMLYHDKLKSFIDRAGILAWGIVPTNEDALKSETVDTLSARLNTYFCKLAEKGITLTDKMLITPACGLGSRTIESAELALKLTSELQYRLSV